MKLAGHGIDLYGREIKLYKNANSNVWCDHNALTEVYLEPNQDIIELYCYGNHLTKLRVPQGIILVECDDNQLEFLYLPDGIIEVHCDGNLLKDLDLPTSVKTLGCDADLFDYDKCKVEYVDIHYK